MFIKYKSEYYHVTLSMYVHDLNMGEFNLVLTGQGIQLGTLPPPYAMNSQSHTSGGRGMDHKQNIYSIENPYTSKTLSKGCYQYPNQTSNQNMYSGYRQ